MVASPPFRARLPLLLLGSEQFILSSFVKESTVRGKGTLQNMSFSPVGYYLADPLKALEKLI